MARNDQDAFEAAAQGPMNRQQNRRYPLRRSVRNLWRQSGEFVFAGMVAALVAVTGYAAYINVVAKGWNADAAAWAQAAGSIIAIAGAAWVARSGSRQARRQRREQGEEAAWAVRFVLSQAQFDAQIVAAELTRQDVPYGPGDIQSWKQRSANASLALQTMLTRADYIHAAVVLTACNAKVLVDHLSIDLAKLEDVVEGGDDPDKQLVGNIVFANLNLKTLIDQYDARMTGVGEALDRGGDMLPLDELRTSGP